MAEFLLMVAALSAFFAANVIYNQHIGTTDMEERSISISEANALLESKRTNYTWKVTVTSSVLGRKYWKLESDVFVTRQYGYQMKATIGISYNEFLLQAGFVQESPSTSSRPILYFHRTTFILLDQSGNQTEKKNYIRMSEPEFIHEDTGEMMAVFYRWFGRAPVSFLQGGPPYIVKNTVLFQVLLEPLSIVMKTYASNNGSLLWRIQNYSSIKQQSQLNIIDDLRSDYFYSSPKGYRMQLTWDFRNTDEHMVLYNKFLKGAWDYSLSRHFPHNTTFMILDQSDSNEPNHLIQRGESHEPWIDEPRPIPYSIIETSKYLKDDSILVKIIVE